VKLERPQFTAQGIGNGLINPCSDPKGLSLEGQFLAMTFVLLRDACQFSEHQEVILQRFVSFIDLGAHL
jgi:hypothetical protein